MSAQTRELFREYTERLKREPEHNPPKAQERTEQPNKPSLVAQMSRIQHEVRQLFDDASAGDRESIVRFLELLIRNLKRVANE